MTTTNETQIIVETEVPMVRIIREFDAPPEKVYRAHTDPELFTQWNGPDSLSTRLDHFDCRTGGAYRYTMTRDDFEAGFHGSFHDVIPNELIVQTFTPDGAPDLVILEKHRFEDLGDGRTRLTATSLVESLEYRDSFLDAGLVDSFVKLDDLLTTF